MHTWKVGDTVKLKSGGPMMTVDETLEDGRVRVKWFDGPTLREEIFQPEVLKTSTPI